MGNKNNPPEKYESIAFRLLNDSLCMADYLIESGMKLPVEAGKELSRISLEINSLRDENKQKAEINEVIKTESEKLTQIYLSLAEAAAPATPLTIRYTSQSSKMFFLWGSQCIPLIRNMMLMSLVFLLGFITTSLTGKTWLINLNLVAAAGLGAYFYSLYTANKYVVNRTFDPKYATFYNNRIIIGIIAGYILASIIRSNFFASENSQLIELTPSVIALLGGFSADAVVKILNRIVVMLVALVKGDTTEIIESKIQEIKQQSEARIFKDKINLARELVENITDLKSKDLATYDKIRSQIDKFLRTTD